MLAIATEVVAATGGDPGVDVALLDGVALVVAAVLGDALVVVDAAALERVELVDAAPVDAAELAGSLLASLSLQPASSSAAPSSTESVDRWARGTSTR